ncbi:hypothetical protein [Exiguobacterium aurantiacum]|uniref:Uncharacterized protein n=1 Tax=Exiguobacterium aurantiacum TaxID=33987 RepID=A0A377FT73_9BACL|nr:hypothetical protein [Exiguobacterium aurantiacum]STO07754.1 Uncharacterised protein [Exiguobacterium aurantiacum]
MGLFDKFQTHIQTDDSHKNEALRTRYFAASPNAVLTWLSEQIKTQGETVRRVDSERGELAFNGEGWDALATIIQVDGGRTAVDFTMNRESRIGPDLGPLVTKYYEALEQKFPLRAIGNQSVER